MQNDLKIIIFKIKINSRLTSLNFIWKYFFLLYNIITLGQSQSNNKMNQMTIYCYIYTHLRDKNPPLITHFTDQ